jgi:hypothetical protein
MLDYLHSYFLWFGGGCRGRDSTWSLEDDEFVADGGRAANEKQRNPLRDAG